MPSQPSYQFALNTIESPFEFRQQSAPSKFVLAGVVAIHADGRVEYENGYTPDAAAREFWDWVSTHAGWAVQPSAPPAA